MSRAPLFQAQLAHEAKRDVTLPHLDISDTYVELNAKETA